MNPDQYIPLYGNEFFQAVEGLSEQNVSRYLRILWHYWHHTHCRGLLNDDEQLRRIARCDKSEWPETKQILFDSDNFFRKEEGLWHQGRCRETYRQKLETAQRYEARAKNAAAKRWKGNK